MSAARGSTAFVVVTGAITLVVIGSLWTLLNDLVVSQFVARPEWSEGSVYAGMARRFVLDAWDWLLLPVLIRMAFEVLVAARLSRSSAALIPESMVLLIIQMMLVIWAYIFPQVLDPLLDIALNSEAVAEAGFDRGIQLAADLAYSYGPGLFSMVTIIWYLVSPIRRDVFRGVR